MRQACSWILALWFLATVPPLPAQLIVNDPITLLKMVQKFKQELAHWKKQIEFWGKAQSGWAAELKQFAEEKAQWEKEGKLLEKLLACAEVNQSIWSHFLGGSSDGRWEELRLKEINDLLALLAGEAGAADAYEGLFTRGKKIAEVFPQLRDWSAVKSGPRYRDSADFREYIDGIVADQTRLLDDLDDKIALLAKLNQLVPEREKKFSAIQKRFEECMKASPVNLPQLWVLAGEVSLEHCRQLFHLVTLGRIETENMLLDELREANDRKREEKLEAKANESQSGAAGSSAGKGGG